MKSTVINIKEIERNIVVGQRVVGDLIIYNSAELSVGGARVTQELFLYHCEVKKPKEYIKVL